LGFGACFYWTWGWLRHYCGTSCRRYRETTKAEGKIRGTLLINRIFKNGRSKHRITMRISVVVTLGCLSFLLTPLPISVLLVYQNNICQTTNSYLFTGFSMLCSV
ncbi:unnamed protein product, partial [Linum tenue]